jgi:hypothetical protein
MALIVISEVMSTKRLDSSPDTVKALKDASQVATKHNEAESGTMHTKAAKQQGEKSNKNSKFSHLKNPKHQQHQQKPGKMPQNESIQSRRLSKLIKLIKQKFRPAKH